MTELIMSKPRERVRTGYLAPALLVVSGAVSLPFYALIFGWLFGLEIGTATHAGLCALGLGLGVVLAGVFSTPRS